MLACASMTGEGLIRRQHPQHPSPRTVTPDLIRGGAPLSFLHTIRKTGPMRIQFLGRRFGFEVPASRAAVAERLRRHYGDVESNPARFGALLNERRAILWAGDAGGNIDILSASLGDCEAGCRIEGRTSTSLLHGLLIIGTPILIIAVLGQHIAGHRNVSLWEDIGVFAFIVLLFPALTFLSDVRGRDLLRALKLWATTDLDRDTVRWAAIPVTRRVTVDGDGMPERVIADAVTMFRMLHCLNPGGGALILKRGEGDNLQFNRNGARFHIDRRTLEETRPLRAIATTEPVLDTFSLEEAMDVAMDYLSDKPLDKRVSWQRLG
jgi:hypothetical protein